MNLESQVNRMKNLIWPEVKIIEDAYQFDNQKIWPKRLHDVHSSSSQLVDILLGYTSTKWDGLRQRIHWFIWQVWIVRDKVEEVRNYWGDKDYKLKPVSEIEFDYKFLEETKHCISLLLIKI